MTKSGIENSALAKFLVPRSRVFTAQIEVDSRTSFTIWTLVAGDGFDIAIITMSIDFFFEVNSGESVECSWTVRTFVKVEFIFDGKIFAVKTLIQWIAVIANFDLPGPGFSFLQTVPS